MPILHSCKTDGGCIKTRLTEILQSYWLVTVVLNSTDHAVDNDVLNTIDNDFTHGLLGLTLLAPGGVVCFPPPAQ